MKNRWKAWQQNITIFLITVLIVAIIGLTIVIQRRNHAVDKIQVATSDIQRIVSEFERASKSAQPNSAQSVKKGLETIQDIDRKLQLILERTNN